MPKYKIRRDRPRPDKSVLWMPLCPFCGEVFAPPADISLDTSVVFGGRCSCGAVYTCDPTGRNQGEAFMDALALASGGYQEALEIGDSDYDEVVLAYDIRKHRLIPKSYGHFSLKIAKLIFIRLNKIA